MTTGKLQVIEPLAYTATSSSGSDTGTANLSSADPKEIFQAASTAARNIMLDFGAPVTLDSIFVGYNNGAGAETVFPYYDPGSGLIPAVTSAVQLRPSDCKTTRANTLIQFTPQTARNWLLAFSAKSSALQVGAIVAGRAFEAEWDREWGSGRKPIDMSVVTQLQGGGFGVQPGAKKASYTWTFGDLTDAETEQLWGIAIRLGNGSPVVMAERSKTTTGASEAVHYGLFQRLDQFERREPGATKWAMTVEEWV